VPGFIGRYGFVISVGCEKLELSKWGHPALIIELWAYTGWSGDKMEMAIRTMTAVINGTLLLVFMSLIVSLRR